MTEWVSIDRKELEALERASYEAQAALGLYLEAMERGIAVKPAREEYIRAFVELDARKCAVSREVDRPGLVRWDADFPKHCIKVVTRDASDA